MVPAPSRPSTQALRAKSPEKSQQLPLPPPPQSIFDRSTTLLPHAKRPNAQTLTITPAGSAQPVAKEEPKVEEIPDPILELPEPEPIQLLVTTPQAPAPFFDLPEPAPVVTVAPPTAPDPAPPITVEEPVTTAAPAAPPSPTAAPGAPIDMSTCTAVDLSTAVGISLAMATSIVAYRQQKVGGFNSMEDLLQVPGMTPEIYAQLTGVEEDFQTLNEIMGLDEGRPVTFDDICSHVYHWPDVFACVIRRVDANIVTKVSRRANFDVLAVTDQVPWIMQTVNIRMGENNKVEQLHFPSNNAYFHVVSNSGLYLVFVTTTISVPAHIERARDILSAFAQDPASHPA
jgi:hypothetical protein